MCFFYNTIIAKPPLCSIRGYASLDRPFLASVSRGVEVDTGTLTRYFNSIATRV